MHQATESGRACRVRSSEGLEVELFWLAGGIGVLPPSTVTPVQLTAGDFVSPLSPSPVCRAHRPEAPPPRS